MMLIRRFACLFSLFLLFVVLLLGNAPSSAASAADGYRQAMVLAAQGRDAEAVAMLAGAGEAAPDVWKERMFAASKLIRMRMQRNVGLPSSGGLHAELITAYAQANPSPVPADARLAGVLASIVPGAGHAWLGRWHDAGVAVMLVWPMLLLTLWAFRRSMGPLTVFFALLTLWLWSGSVFSAISLAERGAFEAYVLWWQGLWQASGLPGRPW